MADYKIHGLRVERALGIEVELLDGINIYVQEDGTQRFHRANVEPQEVDDLIEWLQAVRKEDRTP